MSVMERVFSFVLFIYKYIYIFFIYLFIYYFYFWCLNGMYMDRQAGRQGGLR